MEKDIRVNGMTASDLIKYQRSPDLKDFEFVRIDVFNPEAHEEIMKALKAYFKEDETKE